MNLPSYQTDRFYRIWFVLLHYVKEQRELAPGFPDTPGEASIDPADALQLRNALWADDTLLESFVATNPAGLSPADLELVASLNDTYRNMQEREGIITVLGPTNASGHQNEAPKEMLARNAKVLNAFRKDLAGKGLSASMTEQHASNIDAFAQNWLLTQEPPRGLLDTTLADVQTYLDTTGSRTNTTSFKRFVRFLMDTNRMHYERAAPLRDFLQNARIK